MVPTTSSAEPGASQRRAHVVRTILAVLVIAPLAIAAFYMWALWNPGDTVNRLPVAIVNSDAGADVDGSRLVAGDEVVAALVESGDVNWKVVTAEEAREGVDDGTYYFSVVIPETFSADVASAASGEGRKAQLDVVYNDYNSLVATPVGESVVAQVRSAVSESIGEQSVDQVLIGLGDLGKGFGEAAAGAQQLSAGTKEAKIGADQLYAGSQELSTGLGDANRGGKELAAGAGELAAGADEAAAGSGELSAGMNELVGGTDQLADGARQISEVVDMVTGPVLSVLGEEGDIAAQLVQLRDGARELARQLTDPTADYRGGLLAATAGAAELNTGLGQLSQGAHQLSAGANELSSGLGQLDAGGVQLRDGLGELSTGMGQLDTGSAELATGLTEGAAQVPQFDENQRAKTAGLLSAPVAADEKYDYPAAGFGPGAVPAVMSVLLFLCGILTWFVVRPRRGRSQRVHEGVVREGLRRYRIPALVTLVASLVAAAVSLVVADANPPSALAMTAVMILVGAAAVALGRLFTVVFGPVNGTFIALGALMIQIFAFGAVYPIEQMPAPLRWLHDLMPLTWARNAMRMVLVGYYGPRFWTAVAALVTLIVVAVGFTIWWRRRLEPAADTPPDTPPALDEPTVVMPRVG
ncbi:YhgE/Pip domain-containing protein [Prescottella agglutinans]|uniref:YhgE/Pip domain-containing protein n=1 Tax=Prescottella agglutinans TaxID=1644129 RepID=A0A438BJ18_9NOCA|nr:YhgE/Pip domain-containing protein [Prescottella agglutinans]RVW11060.1 YhgE/Pip domain-containing protein [Prescottella agglutinans]